MPSTWRGAVRSGKPRAVLRMLAWLLSALAIIALCYWLLAAPVLDQIAYFRLNAMRTAQHGQPLVAPFDLPARRAALGGEDLHFATCPPAPAPMRTLPEIERFYADAKQSVRDESKWLAAMARLRDLRVYGIQLGTMNTDHMIDAHPDPARAACMRDHLQRWAAADAMSGEPKMMTSSNRAWFVLINAATTLIILKQDGSITPAQSAPIERWLQRQAWSVIAFDDHMYRRIKNTPRYPNNHVYWAGAAAVAVGVATQDNRLFMAGVAFGRAGLDQVDEAGMLSGELWRGERAFAYTLWAAAPLALIVRYAQANGIPLIDANRGALMRLARTTSAIPSSSALFEQRAQAAPVDRSRPWPHYAGDLAFVELVLASRDDRALQGVIAPYRPLGNENLGGDLTILYAPPAVARQALAHPGIRLPSPPL